MVAYCTCKSEETSLEAAMRLSELGFANVAVLRGGYPAWASAGFPLESNREPVVAVPSPGRLAPPAAVRCDRNELTSYAGKVSRYRRLLGKTTLAIHTSADTLETITIKDPLRSYLINGTPFTASDWNRIELRKGVLRRDMSAVAWVCTSGDDGRRLAARDDLHRRPIGDLAVRGTPRAPSTSLGMTGPTRL